MAIIINKNKTILNGRKLFKTYVSSIEFLEMKGLNQIQIALTIFMYFKKNIFFRHIGKLKFTILKVLFSYNFADKRKIDSTFTTICYWTARTKSANPRYSNRVRRIFCKRYQCKIINNYYFYNYITYYHLFSIIFATGWRIIAFPKDFCAQRAFRQLYVIIRRTIAYAFD